VISAVNSNIIALNERVLVMITGSGLKDTKNAIRAGGQPTAVEPSVAAIEKALKETAKKKTQCK
jgi:threonine synthase